MSDNISHHEINEETQFQVNKKKHEAAKRKCKPKTETQRLKKVFYIFTVIWVICQVISATLAGTGFYYFASVNIQGNPMLVGSITLVASLILEWMFNELNQERAKQKYDDETPVSSIINKSILGLLIVYGGSTYFGSPYSVQLLATPPSYHDIEQISANHDALITKDTLKWNQDRFMAQSAADAYLKVYGKRDCNDVKLCPWRIKTKFSGRHNELLGRVDSVAYPAATSLAVLEADKKQDIKTLKDENKVMKANHLEWCGSFGFALSLISILCIAVFLITFDWTQKYKRDEIIDNDSILKKLSEADDKVKAQERLEIEKLKAAMPKVEVQDKGEEPPKVIDKEPSIPIGFAIASTKEGDILKGEGRKSDRVYVEVKGELRAMTPGELNTLIKGQSTPQRISHLTGLRNKLN